MTMGFLLLVSYLALSFLRPTDLYPSLASHRLMLWFGIMAIVGSVLSLIVGRRPTFRAPQTYLMVAFIGSIAMSHIVRGWFGGGLWALEDFGFSATFFFLVFLNTTSLARLRVLGVVLVLVSMVLVLQGTLAYHYGYKEDLLIAKQSVEGPEEKGTHGSINEPSDAPAEVTLKRIRSLGFLNDPNDLAQFLLVALAVSTVAWRSGSWLWNSSIVIGPSLFLLYGIYLTHSRGGLIGLLTLVLLALRNRFKRLPAFTMTVFMALMLLALNFTGGRNLSLEDASAQGRLDAWGGGLAMLKFNPVWGVGYGTFADLYERTAHNSFVLCFAELGLIGYFFWLALIVTTVLELRRLKNLDREDRLERELQRWSEVIRLAFYSFLVCAWFLSRTYNMTMYLLLGLSAALVDMARRAEKPGMDLPLTHWTVRTGALAVATIGLIYLTVRFNYAL